MSVEKRQVELTFVGAVHPDQFKPVHDGAEEHREALPGRSPARVDLLEQAVEHPEGHGVGVGLFLLCPSQLLFTS